MSEYRPAAVCDFDCARSVVVGEVDRLCGLACKLAQLFVEI